MIRVRGFEMLFDLLTKRAGRRTDIEARFGAMIRGYVEFGLTYPSYYDIMFNLQTSLKRPQVNPCFLPLQKTLTKPWGGGTR